MKEKMTREQLASEIRYLREMVRQLQNAGTRITADDVDEICNEIYGTTNKIQEAFGEDA